MSSASLHSPSTSINFIFNFVHLADAIAEYARKEHALIIDAQQIANMFLVCMFCTLVLIKQLLDLAKRGEQLQLQSQQQQQPVPQPQQPSQSQSQSQSQLQLQKPNKTKTNADNSESESLTVVDEGLLLKCARAVFAGSSVLYAHCFYVPDLESYLSSADSTTVIIIGAAMGLACIQLIAIKLYPTGDGICPRGFVESFQRVWRKYLFMFPRDCSDLIWLVVGYSVPRMVFAQATATCWAAYDRTDTAETIGAPFSMSTVERIGSELCAYTWSSTGGPRSAPGNGIALRSCFDLSGLCLIFAGIVWPIVELIRSIIVVCMRGKVPNDDDASQGSSQSSSVKPQPAAPHAFDASGMSVIARVLQFCNMFGACMFTCWLVHTVALARGYHHNIIRSEYQTACPSVLYHSMLAAATDAGAAQRYDVELHKSLSNLISGDVSLLKSSCEFQWSYLQNINMAWYVCVGLLSAIFGTIPNPLPVQFRLQFFVVLCMSLWKGSLLPSCLIISTQCLS